MRLDVADRIGRHARALQGLPHDFGLGGRVRRGERAGVPTGIDHAALDDGMDHIAIGPRLLERLEQHHAAGFAGHETVRGLAERPTAGAGGEHRGASQIKILLRIDQQIHATGQCDLATAAAQAFQRQVDRGERSRTGSIHRQAWPAKIELVRHAVGDLPEARSAAVVTIHHTYEYTYALALAERARRVAGIFDPGIGLL